MDIDSQLDSDTPGVAILKRFNEQKKTDAAATTE